MKIKTIRLTQVEKDVLFFIQDLVKDPVKLSVDVDRDKKEVDKTLKKLKKLGLVKIKKSKKCAKVEITDKGREFFENKLRRFYY